MLRRGSEFTYLLTVANNSALFVYFKINDQEVPGCIVHLGLCPTFCSLINGSYLYILTMWYLCVCLYLCVTALQWRDYWPPGYNQGSCRKGEHPQKNIIPFNMLTIDTAEMFISTLHLMSLHIKVPLIHITINGLYFPSRCISYWSSFFLKAKCCNNKHDKSS